MSFFSPSFSASSRGISLASLATFARTGAGGVAAIAALAGPPAGRDAPAGNPPPRLPMTIESAGLPGSPGRALRPKVSIVRSTPEASELNSLV
jgi:hypothetical protein